MKYLGIHGVPRSGTSWLGALLDSSPSLVYKMQPLFSYSFKDYLNEDSSKKEILDFFSKIALKSDPFLDQTDKKKDGKYPIFCKDSLIKGIVYKEVRYHNILENMLFKCPELKIIGIIRNPLSVINSWLNAPREFRLDLKWNIYDEWRFAQKKNCDKKEEFFGYEKWKEVANKFLKLKKEYPGNFYLIIYMDLLSRTIIETEKIFNFIGIEITAQTYEFINNSGNIKDSDPYSVFRYKQNDDKWKNELDKKIRDDIIKDCIDSKLEQFL